MTATYLDRITGIETSVAIKAPVVAATTAAITLSGEQTIDGVAVVSGDRVLVKDQAGAIDNGIWDVSTGSWSRSDDFNGVRDAVRGTKVLVNYGATWANAVFALTTATPTIGVSDLAFSSLGTNPAQSIGSGYATAGSRAVAQATVIDPSVVTVRVVGGAHVLEYERDPAGTALITADGAKWSPIGNVRPEHWGAVGDGVADDKAAFDAIEAFGKQAWLSGTYRLSVHPEPRAITYVLETGASVIVDSSNWLPRMYQETGPTVRGDHINYATNDPSPVIVGAEYVELPNSHIWRGELVNWWGAQHADLNNPLLGRTAVEAMRINMQQLGEGDVYAMSLNGIAFRHSRFAEITSVKGQNNVGVGGGQMNAGSDQVTLYGWGDVVLHDQGFDNVALRGHVILLYTNGADTLGYTVDRFGYMVGSLGANDIAVGFVARGKMRAAIDTTGATLSGTGSLVTKAGQKVFFDASGATTQTGYTAPVLGTYSVGKDIALPQLDINADGSVLRLLNNRAELRPAVANNEALRVYEAGGARYAALTQSGNVTFLTARDPGAGNTSMVLRTTQAGVANDRLTVDGAGNVNVMAASATVGLQSAGTKVVGVQQAAIPDAIGGTEIATINSILVALRAHGLIAT